MTSIATVKKEVGEFLESDKPSVLCITGKWGTGKTFAWREMVKLAADEQKLGLKKYSYISLFGLTSLTELKTNIAESMQILQSEIGQSYLNTVRDESHNLFLKSVKVLKNFTSAIPYIGKALSDFQALYFPLVVNDALVCLDDLDRHSTQIRVSDILGLVTSLREDRGCKVALLLNEDGLSQEDSQTLARHFEKVIDTRLVFSPTAEEAVSIALEGEEGWASNPVKENCCKLQISNIRVIQKIMRLVKQVQPLIEHLSDDVKNQTAHTIVILAWSKFEPDTAPNLDFLSRSSFRRYMEDKDEKEMSDKEAAWVALIEDYGFEMMDDYDKALSEYVLAGIVDGDKIRFQAEAQNAEVGRQAATAAIEAGFRPYHDSFDNNVDEVAKSIKTALENNYSFVNFRTLNGAVQLLKQIGKQEDADALLQYFADHQTDGGFWDFENDAWSGPVDSDVRVVAQRNLAAKRLLLSDPIAELLDVAQSYNSEKIKLLASILTPDLIYDAIKASNGIEMRKIIRSGLDFARIGNASPEMLVIVDCTKKALAKLAQDSELNATRVSKYGIKPDESKS